MNHLPHPELFSAYLDGELTAEEEAQVEHLLADSPAARQLLEELRSLSQTLQTLPNLQLAEDLSPHVLRAAERRVLADSRLPAPRGRSWSWGTLREALPLSRLLRPRVVLWTAVVLVVAVVFSFQDAARRPVAEAPQAEVPQAELSMLRSPVAVVAPEPAPPEEAVPAATAPAVELAPPAAVDPAVTAASDREVPSLASSPAPETGPVPAGEPASGLPAAAAPPLAVASETPWMVRGEIDAQAAKQGVLQKLLAEQKLPPAATETPAKETATPSGTPRTLRVQVVANGKQLTTLLTQMQEQEAFSALAVTSTAPKDTVATTPAAPETREAAAGSVVIEKKPTSGRKPSAKSRVLFDRDAPAPPPVEHLPELPAEDLSVARPIVFELQIVPAKP